VHCASSTTITSSLERGLANTAREGDGVQPSGEEDLTITTQTGTELLLFDLA
jgi:hypothetical protein